MIRRIARHRGMSFIELLAAVVVISIVGASAIATWGLSSRIPATLRRAEMASKIAVHEIELIKAKRYINTATGTTTTTTYYDKNGVATTVTADQLYRATTVLGIAPGMTATSTTKDLLQVQVTVANTAGTITYETQRTLMTFGGF